MPNENWVTQDQCENRMQRLIEDNKKQTEDIGKLYGEIKALTVNVENLVQQNKWFMGIISGVMIAMIVYLFTH
jgi:hypothetical protein